jgi:hypothetical protein
MKTKLFFGLMLAALTLVSCASGALAEKLICISKEELKGQETVRNCLARGEKFAIVDEHGAVRILTKEEIEVMKKINPKVFDLPAYGIIYEKEAPPMPKLPHHAIPKKYQ